MDGGLKVSPAEETAEAGEPREFDWAAPGSESGAARRAAATTEEERLTVLRMLVAGKITAADAERLLQAPEGEG